MARGSTEYISVRVKLEVLITSFSVDLWKIHGKQAVTEVTMGFFDFLIHHKAANTRQLRYTKFWFRTA